MKEIITSFTKKEKSILLIDPEFRHINEQIRGNNLTILLGLDLLKSKRIYNYAKDNYVGEVGEITELELRYAIDRKYTKQVNSVWNFFEDLELIKLMLFTLI